MCLFWVGESAACLARLMTQARCCAAAKATELVVQLQAAELAAEEEKTASHSAGEPRT
jgi:hypothetical protein